MVKTAAILAAADTIFYLLVRASIIHGNKKCDGLMFLSDITRPAFLIDLNAVQRAHFKELQKEGIATDATNTVTYANEQSVPIPSIHLPQSKGILVPYHFSDHATSGSMASHHTFDPTLDPIDILHSGEDLNNDARTTAGGDLCFGYIHCQVVKPSSSKSQDRTFLCQLNLNSTTYFKEGESSIGSPCDTVRIMPAHLVLGLNNHHVISYYWARSAGGGSAMEAPGVVVVYDSMTSTVQLRWASKEGYTACNSNDGKRSEWVQYLKENDQIQLRPNSFETIVRSEAFRECIYGITMSGRPLGSEPMVVCQWHIDTCRN